MQIEAVVMWRTRYDGEKQVYLTGIEIGGPGDVKLAGEFGEVPLFVPLEISGEVEGRIYGQSYTLKVVDPSKFRMKPVKAASGG